MAGGEENFRGDRLALRGGERVPLYAGREGERKGSHDSIHWFSPSAEPKPVLYRGLFCR